MRRLHAWMVCKDSVVRLGTDGCQGWDVSMSLTSARSDCAVSRSFVLNVLRSSRPYHNQRVVCLTFCNMWNDTKRNLTGTTLPCNCATSRLKVDTRLDRGCSTFGQFDFGQLAEIELAEVEQMVFALFLLFLLFLVFFSFFLLFFFFFFFFFFLILLFIFFLFCFCFCHQKPLP